MKCRTLVTSLAACLGLTALAGPAAAHRFARPADSRLGSLMQVGVVDRSTGRELPVYRHRSEFWVAGTPGTRYAIRLRNMQGERLLAVMSVDGVNVVSGETASPDQNGYVLSGGERADIAGWRKSDSQIAAFEFTSLDNAYASRTGRPDNVGVIGVAMFRERPAPMAVPPMARGAESAESQAKSKSTGQAGAEANAGHSGVASPAPTLGTGHGRRETSRVDTTTFERASSTPDEVVRIRYDSRANLLAAGIIPPPPGWPVSSSRPLAFPASGQGYVPDPPPRH